MIGWGEIEGDPDDWVQFLMDRNVPLPEGVSMVDAGGGGYNGDTMVQGDTVPDASGSIANAKPSAAGIDKQKQPSTSRNNQKQEQPEAEAATPSKPKVKLIQSSKLPPTITPVVTPAQVEIPEKNTRKSSGGTAYLVGNPSKARAVMEEKLSS